MNVDVFKLEEEAKYVAMHGCGSYGRRDSDWDCRCPVTDLYICSLNETDREA